MLWELANGLARRGHEVHFVHGPAWPDRITRLDQLPPFEFEPSIRHHIVDSLDEPDLPAGDVVFDPKAPRRLGHPVVIIQGFRMLPRRVERDTFHTPAPKVCVARWLVDIGRGHGVADEQLWYVPLGLDHEVFARRAPYDARVYDVAMLYHVHASKGWVVGLEVLRELARTRADFRGVVFGIYPPPDELPDGVDLRVDLDHRRLADEVYNATKVFVQPSFHEGFGYTAVEAMACGAALVSTDNGGSRDYATHDVTARVVAPGDVAGLVAQVDLLLDDDSTRTRLAEAGTAHVRRFDWDRAAELLEHHLEAYLADPEALQRAPDPGATREQTA